MEAAYLLNQARSYTSYDKLEKMKKEYGSIFITKDEKEALAVMEDALSNMKTSSDGYNFAFPDATGKIVKLSDFKGKVVYIDIWATWCGPCKREIPHLEALEEAMHGKDVVFVSISLDEDQAKWLKFIEKSKGIQLHDPKKEMGKRYNITGIPRFLLFDKNGKIITSDAIRPSNEKIITFLEKYL